MMLSLRASGCNGTADHGYQFAEIVVGSRGFHRSSRWRFQFQHMGQKALAELHGNVIEAALTFGIVAEMLESIFPITVVGALVHRLAEVFDEALAPFGVVDEAEILVDDGLYALTAYQLGICSILLLYCTSNFSFG